MALNEGIFGEEGKFTFKAPNTSLFFDSANVDTVGDTITFTKDHLYVTGHKVQVVVDPGTGSALPTPLLAATDYFVIVVSEKVIQLAASEADALGGTNIDITAAGTGLKHSIALEDFDLVASCRGWTINPSKAIVDVTTLTAAFRSYKGGLIDLSGSANIFYEAADDLDSVKARKIFDALLLPYDDGDGEVELFLSTVDISDEDRKIVAPVIFSDFSLGNQIGQILEFTVNFRLNGQPTLTNVTG